MSTTIAKIARHYQITIPRSVRQNSGLKEGDLVNFEIRNGEIVMNPICIVKKDQAYFFNPKWQKEIKTSEEEIKKGRYKAYHSGRELKEEIEK